MREIWRHLCFDLRRMGWLAGISVGLVGFAPWLGQAILALVVVPLLMINHKAAGSRAWWLVRPLNRTRLAIAKIFSIALLWAGVFGVLSVPLLKKGFHPELIALCNLEAILPFAAVCGLTGVLACLSRDLRRYFLLVGASLVVAFSLIIFWIAIFPWALERWPRLEPWIPLGAAGQVDVWFLISFFAAAGLPAAILFHYRNRRIRWTLGAAMFAVLAPLYFVPVLMPRWVDRGRAELVSTNWTVSIAAEEVVAKEVLQHYSARSGTSIPVRPGHWNAEIPLEFHTPAPIPADQSLEFVSDIPFGNGGIDGRIRTGWWWIHRKSAVLNVAGVSSAEPIDSGRVLTASISGLAETWFDRPLAIRAERKERLGGFRARFTGELRLDGNPVVNDGANRFQLYSYREDDEKIPLYVETLRPITEFNPARKFIAGREDYTVVLWDDRKSVAHFPQSLTFWVGDQDGGFDLIVPEFPGVDFREPSRRSDFRILLVRHERIGIHDVGIEAGTFFLRRPLTVEPE